MTGVAGQGKGRQKRLFQNGGINYRFFIAGTTPAISRPPRPRWGNFCLEYGIERGRGERNQTGGDDQYRKQRLGLRVKAFGRGGNTCTDKRRMKSGVRRTSSPTSILLLTVGTVRKSSGEGYKGKMKEVTDRPEIGLCSAPFLSSVLCCSTQFRQIWSNKEG